MMEMTMHVPEISSVGLPPEKHADRVVAEMMRYMIKRREQTSKLLTDCVVDGFFAASPRAQNRLAERLRKTGATLDLHMQTGKKGCYKVSFFELGGWDPARNDYIDPQDPMPDKPWLVGFLTTITNPGKRYQRRQLPLISNKPFVFITHHVLSRAAQRLGLRTADDLRTLSEVVVLEGANWYHDKPDDAVDHLPPAGDRINISQNGLGMTLILTKHESRHALVATTLFANDQLNQAIAKELSHADRV